jgi:2-hydroxy-6-oxonona-2,4-dienedioate hydrolase
MQDETITVDGLTIHLQTSRGKSRQSLFFVHGIGVSGRYMVPLAQALSRRYDTYVIDLPGFGRSTGPRQASLDQHAHTLAAIIRHYGLENITLIGNSFGCQVCLKMLRFHPGLASAAILIGPTINKYERTYPQMILRWLQNLQHEPKRQFAWLLIKDIYECGVSRVFTALSIALKDRPEDTIKAIDIPILLLRGEHDPIAPRPWLELLAGHQPNVQISELPGAGHALNFNSPAPLARIITQFLTGR